MRRILIIAAAAMLAAPAAADPPSAQQAFVERRGLIEVDRRCRLLAVGPRTALEAGAAQARGALLRAGWTPARVEQLDSAVRQAAQERACTDGRTRAAVDEARAAYADWATAGIMEFPGWRRTWTARRTVGVNGWRLSQAIDAPIDAVFGVRESEGLQRLTLIIPGADAAAATLSFRDTGRASASGLDLTRRVALGLEAGAPGMGVMTRDFSGARRSERIIGRSQTAFTFPDSAFAALLQLDPRETIVLRVRSGRETHTLHVEVGDIAAARTFLTLRPS